MHSIQQHVLEVWRELELQITQIAQPYFAVQQYVPAVYWIYLFYISSADHRRLAKRKRGRGCLLFVIILEIKTNFVNTSFESEYCAC